MPNDDSIENISEILDMVCEEYKEFLSSNKDKDDPEELADIMDTLFHDMGIKIEVLVGPKNAKAVDWYIQSAIVAADGTIVLVLDPDSIDGYWGPETFKQSVVKTLEHEHIHLSQRDRMGKKKYKQLPSGYQLGLRKKEKTGKERDLIRTYLRDPHELMAHGHDLAREIQKSKNPEEALRNPEKYRSELPTYDKHREIFPSNSKPLQRLLLYATNYINYYNAIDK